MSRNRGEGMSSDNSIIRVKPYYYLHVLDNNTNVTRLVVGPLTFIRQDHEKVILGPEPMIQVPPRQYADLITFSNNL